MKVVPVPPPRRVADTILTVTQAAVRPASELSYIAPLGYYRGMIRTGLAVCQHELRITL